MVDEALTTTSGGTPGERLARAREASGMSIADVAARTRIQQRHLQALEDGNFAAMPGRTYVVGFAKTYARTVGLNEAEIGAAVARDFAGQASEVEIPTTPAFTPGDPARVPSSRFAWAAAGAVLVVAIAVFVWWENTGSPAAGLPSLIPIETSAPVLTAAPTEATSALPSETASASPGGPVVFTSEIDGLWVKFSDGAGKTLLQKQLARGETYTLPADVTDPKIWTGRPDALAITIGGQSVPKLADQQKLVKDVQVSATALLARGKALPVSAPVAAPVAAVPGAPIPSATSSQANPVHRVARRRRPVESSAAVPGAEPATPPPTAPVAPSTAQ